MKRGGNSFVVVGMAAAVLALSTVASVAGDKWAPNDAMLQPAQRLFLHLGFSAVPYDEGSTITIGGLPDPGGDIRLDPSYTLAAEIGYYLTPNFAIAFSSGYPPTVAPKGAGNLAIANTFGKVTGGMMELNLQYHFTNFGAFQPYVGAGPTYFHVFSTQDGSLSNFSVSDAWGANLQIGADWMLSKNIGMFFDVKKVFLSTKSTGTATLPLSFPFSSLPFNADVRLDPTIVSVGLTLRY